MHNCRTFWLWALLTHTAAAQTSVGGVINTYHRVTQTAAAGWVRVDVTTGLAAGDAVLIIQMKGATVTTADNASFGSITNLNSAGNYELNSICAVRSDTVYLFRQLAQAYTITDKVQLVKVPQYASAVVTAPLQAMPWDSTTGKGGVVAIKTGSSLTLNASISASGAGYLGGALVTSSGTCFNFLPTASFFYNATVLNPQNGAYKGEGIAAGLTVNYTGGKGAAANGGGGGNNHNNGGGGGSNLTAGGLGGGNSSANGCSLPNAGRGGHALTNNSGAKIFMGGGGGAGHINSGAASTGGGRGGGIVFIVANELTTNGHSISADGSAGGAAVGDGASGGGAGGTVVLAVNNYLDAVQVSAKGGTGGTEDDVFTFERCYGEGGGGSGGAVFFKTAVPAGTADVAGGPKGARINSNSCATIVAGSNGMAGIVTPNYQFIEATNLAAPCGALLAVELLHFGAQVYKQDVVVEWKASGIDKVSFIELERKDALGTWIRLIKAPPVALATNRYIDQQLPAGNYSYRLRLILTSGREIISKVQTVTVGFVQPLLVPNPARNVVIINFPFAPNTIIVVTDVTGRTVAKQVVKGTANIVRQDVSRLGKGVYMMRIGSTTARLVRY